MGTPCYVFDAAAIRRNVAALRAALPAGSRLYFSAKAHANVAILRLLRECGTGIDACSLGDLAFAEAAGFVGDEVTFHAHGCTPDVLATAIDRGATVIADSIGQLRHLATMRPGSDVGLRINPGVAAPVARMLRAGATGAKFGIHPSQLAEALDVCRAGGLRIIGLHGHVGSDLLDPGAHLALLDTLLGLRAGVPDLEFIDLGGGWGTPFLPATAGDEYPPVDREVPYPLPMLRSGIDRVLSCHPRAAEIELRAEPGAFLLMAAGLLLTTVTDIKEPAPAVNSADSARFVCTDTSYSHVHSAVVRGTFHEVLLVGDDGRPRERQTVTGNLMQAGDVLAADRVLPRLEVGDLLAVLRCGAYKASLASNFNNHPRPAEVLVDGSTTRLVRRHERIPDLLALQADVVIDST